MPRDISQLDLVYPLKSGSTIYEELRYSLRSVCKNLPHNKVCIIGSSIPVWLTRNNIYWLPVEDDIRKCKADNVAYKLRLVCEDENISDPFILMNDDFFILKEIKSIPYYSWGKIWTHLKDLSTRHDNPSVYMKNIISTAEYLEGHGYTTYDFGIHAPIVIDKAAMLQVLDLPEGNLYTRTAYANIKGVKPTIVEDFKYYELTKPVDFSRPLASTGDDAFKWGVAGRDIRSYFNKTCKYERGHTDNTIH